MFRLIRETGLQGKQGHLGYGYFQLFNSMFLENIGLTEFGKLYPEISTHAGFDDHIFSNYFPEKRSFDLTAVHLGESEKHWWGHLKKKIL